MTDYRIPGRGNYCDVHHYRLDHAGNCPICTLANARRADPDPPPAPAPERGDHDLVHDADPEDDAVRFEAVAFAQQRR